MPDHADAGARTRLLLFTNDYPYATGDVVFVSKEIDALAAKFDDVVVFCHARDTSVGTVPLPANVRLGGNLFAPSPEDSPRTILRPRTAAGLARAAWRELRSGRLLGHVRLFLMGARVGITQAHRVAVREAIAEADDVIAYAFWGMGGGLALPWLRGVRARVVRVHGYDLYEERAVSGYLPLRPQLFAAADRVLTVSEDGARYLEGRSYGRGPAAAGKIHVSRLGVAGPAAVDRPARGDELLIASCSALIDLKRVDRILDAVHIAAARTDRTVRWVHFGDGPELPALRAAAAATDGVEIELRGRTPNTEIAAFYASRRVDVFVNASSSEGVPVSIMEAIAYGIPVVATAVGGTPEIVGAALGSGELVDADASAEALADTLLAVADAREQAYDPRALWERAFDVERTGPAAAALVVTAGGSARADTVG